MAKHLKNTHKQKDRLEQIILRLDEKYYYCFGLDLPKTASNTSSITKNDFQSSAKPLNDNKNIIDDTNPIPEETELNKVKQDYIIEMTN